ncbi:MAG: TonB-dependent receptor [Bacteroidia bacterium]|nr:TonB-dependent receptor [Bacteroidia bacterium]
MQAWRLLILGGFLLAQRDTAELELSPILIHAERLPLLEPQRVLLPEGRVQLTLGDVLSTIPGIEWMQTGSLLLGRPVVRGHSYTRVGWLFGGLMREGAYWGEDHGYETPPQLLTYEPEVLLGPQSVRYGSEAIGGLVRFQPLVPKRAFLKLQMQGTSNPLGLLLQGAGAVGTPQRFLMGEALFQSAENFYTPRHAFVWNTGMRSGYGYLTGRMPIKQGFTEIAGFQTLQIVGLPSPVWQAETREWFSEAQQRYIPVREAWRFTQDLPFQRILSSGLQVRTLWEETAGTTNGLIVGFQRNERAEYGELPATPDVRILTQRADIDFARRGKDWESGFTGFLRQTRDKGVEPFLPSILHGEGGVWVRHRRPGLRGRFLLGGRIHAGWSQAQTQRTFLTWAGELTYARAAFALRLTRSFRLPHPAELWASGFHEGAKRYEYGRSDLPPEVAYTAEGLLSFASAQIRPFFQYFPRYIFAERLPDTLTTAVGAAFTYGVRQAFFTGAEAEWQSQLFSIGIGYVLGHFLAQPASAERFVPRVPPLRCRLSGRYAYHEWSFFPEVLLYAPQLRAYTLYSTEVPTPGYVLLNLALRWRFVTLGVQNLLGTRYQPHLSAYRQWIAGGIDFPSQNFYLTVELDRLKTEK